MEKEKEKYHVLSLESSYKEKLYRAEVLKPCLPVKYYSESQLKNENEPALQATKSYPIISPKAATE